MRFEQTDIAAAWPLIRDGLEYVKEVTHAPWSLADVYAECAEGDAALYLIPDGFFIVKIYPEDYSFRTEMLVWIAYSKAGDAFREYEQDLDQLAHMLGADSIVVWSPRPGMGRLLGWPEDTRVYRKRLWPYSSNSLRQ